MALELTVVDAFTDRPFTGNPAAVAVVDAFPAEESVSRVALLV
jgi:predicted PhzF superfamily epimerase YddE/YHI9